MEHLVFYYEYDEEDYTIELYRQSIKLYKGRDLLFRKYIDGKDNKVTSYYSEDKDYINTVVQAGFNLASCFNICILLDLYI